MPSATDGSAILNAFLRIFLEDLEAGRVRALADCQALFPGHAALIEREFQRVASEHSGKGSIAPLAGSAESGPSSEFMKKLGAFSPPQVRYQLRGEVARGGMGAILKVWDESLRRNLAMKVVLGREDPLSKGSTPAVDQQTLGRFLEEAQVTGQLDHPGVVPVHELGVSEERGVYFTMRLVKGQDLGEIFKLVREGKEGWTQTRALNVLLKACETMSYAHSKNVIHRDLKPSNVMVGKFGEVYVMDWGLAKVMGEEDRHDLRLRPVATSLLQTERGGQAADSPLLTMDGTVVGTPSYMPLEQAEGKLEEIGPRSDVYSMGAMLYELLTGQAPYVRPGSKPSPYTVLAAILQGPPTPVHELDPHVPAELEAICDKAMARKIEARYRDMGELGEDLSAYIENRVVSAHQTGPVAELRKWIARNKPLAAALASGFLAVVIGLGASLALKAQSDRNAKLANDEKERAERGETLARENEATAKEERERADREAAAATKRADEVLRLSASQDLEDLVAKADKLWPSFPENISALEEWIGKARRLVADLSLHRSKVAELRSKALPQSAEERKAERESHPKYARLLELEGELTRQADAAAEASTDEAVHAAEDELARLEEERGELESEVSERRDWQFPEAEGEARWWNNQLTKLIQGLEELERGLLAEDGTSPEHGRSVPKRLEFARTLQKEFADGGEYFRKWSEALPEIRAAYPGLSLTPQLGLVPIGPDPKSGLWEFAHLQSGEIPERDADRKLLVLTDTSGLVFVLLPGGTFQMGAQKSDPNGPNYDPQAEVGEDPVHMVTLAAFFLSKYEMTQGQWLLFTGRNPSVHDPKTQFGGKKTTLLHPVEMVSWTTCAETLKRLGLALPTEAQWEYSARARTTSPWWTGDEKESLVGAANLLDSFCSRNGGPQGFVFEDWLDDGYLSHAPVGSFLANAFGLHDVMGNLGEFCRDWGLDYRSRVRPGDGKREETGSTLRLARGGHYFGTASQARSACRFISLPEVALQNVGVRPAKSIEP